MNIKTMHAHHDDYYQTTYNRWRVNKEKAGKDIVGEEFENKRRRFYQTFGFKTSCEKIGSYNPDVVVSDKQGKIVVIEEAKGHYTDSCFFDRFMMNAARVFSDYIEKGTKQEDIPYFVLSCMTKFAGYEEKYKLNKRLFSKEIQNTMDKKLVYLPYCNHDRVPAKKYFKNSTSCFELSDKLLEKQIKFVSKSILGGRSWK